MYMDEVNMIASTCLDDITRELDKYKLSMDEITEDLLFDELQGIIETLAGYPEYRNYN